MLGFGWCHLRSSRKAYGDATWEAIDAIDAACDKADQLLRQEFRKWMAANSESYIQWQLFDHLNNHHGLLTYCVSRNHRTSAVWSMLEWIAQNGRGSYGLFYCHDDEDTMDRGAYGRQPPMDYDNVFRVHRLMNGELVELSDPFFGALEGGIDPIHPQNRPTP